MQLPEKQREQVRSVTMDLSDCMRAIAKEAFPKAIAIRDCFHVVRRGGEACEEIRLRLKRDAVRKQNKDKAEFRKHLTRLASQRKAYRERMREKNGKNWKKGKRGRKPQRLNTRFVPQRLENGESLVEALTRCSKQLTMSREKWSETQESRAKILFSLYPKLEEAYNLINSLRAIFRNKDLDKETARPKFDEWYDKVAKCTLREVKSVRDTIKFYEDEILNYFIDGQTNASSESLNSKIKCFRTQVKGVCDIPFFMYRLATVFGLAC
jgi:transposase